MQKVKACEQQKIDITDADIPLSCPMDRMRLWDGHPKVYLPIEETGHEMCPYCGTEYFLKKKAETE